MPTLVDGGGFSASTYISTNVNITSNIHILIEAAIVDQVDQELLSVRFSTKNINFCLVNKKVSFNICSSCKHFEQFTAHGCYRRTCKHGANYKCAKNGVELHQLLEKVSPLQSKVVISYVNLSFLPHFR